MSHQACNFEILENGNLKISLDGENGRFELFDLMDKRCAECLSDDNIFIELIEYQLENGWQLLDSSQTGDLTDSMILSDNAPFNDHGDLEDIDYNKWWFPQYVYDSYVEDLFVKGFVIWSKD